MKATRLRLTPEDVALLRRALTYLVTREEPLEDGISEGDARAAQQLLRRLAQPRRGRIARPAARARPILK